MVLDYYISLPIHLHYDAKLNNILINLKLYVFFYEILQKYFMEQTLTYQFLVIASQDTGRKVLHHLHIMSCHQYGAPLVGKLM